MDGFIASIWAAIVAVLVLCAFSLGKDSAASECQNFGAFESQGVVYKCERVAK